MIHVVFRILLLGIYVVSLRRETSLPLGAWDRLFYFIVALPVPSI